MQFLPSQLRYQRGKTHTEPQWLIEVKCSLLILLWQLAGWKTLKKWGAYHRNNFGNMRGNQTQKAKMWHIANTFKTYGKKTLNFVKPLVIITFSSCGAIRPLILWSPPLPLLSICGTRRHFIMWSPPLPLLCHTSRKEDHPFCEDLCYSYLFYLLKLCHTVVKEK